MRNRISASIRGFLRERLYAAAMGQNACPSVIKEELQKDKPSMIARFGATEIKAVLYPGWPRVLRSIMKKRVFGNMETLSGFFPATEDAIRKFSELMIEDMKLLDVLGSWRFEEAFLLKYFASSKRVRLRQFEPYFQEEPWSEVLQNKKVLVVHPFNTTIESQYRDNRQVLFKDKRVLPEFKTLETIKAVQTIAGNHQNFADWFSALSFMKGEINKKDFDVAIIGCGAYGFPLAAHVKRMGKKAVHLGGPTQLLFGIKGRRWLELKEFRTIINDYFVRPAGSDVPENSGKVEGGCYW